MRNADFPVIVLFAGVDGAGKSECANLLSFWMDPRSIVTRAFGKPTEEERQRPELFRYWIALPRHGRIGIFLSAWYHRPLIDQVYGDTTNAEFEARLEQLRMFEKTLADSGALVLKFWMHLDKEDQRERLKTLESDELTSWRVTGRDWKNWNMYDTFVATAKRITDATDAPHAPWIVVQGNDRKSYSLEVGERLLAAIKQRLAEPRPEPEPVTHAAPGALGLDDVDMTRTLPKDEYRRELERYRGRLNRLYTRARERGIPIVLVFEGWDAGGKGGTIRRLCTAIGAHFYHVHQIGAPRDEEAARHYLWRFWRRLPRAGRVAIFDRSWYGRVLVERVEGFAAEADWRRAYEEINDFEAQLTDHGYVVVKFWMHITKDEQERRFRARAKTPHKRWKLTDEDWRNRERWHDYEVAVHDMLERTDTPRAPWILVESNDKRFARVKVAREVCAALERALEEEPA